MRIAVASGDFVQVTGHAGRARRWLIFEAGPGHEPIEVSRIELDREQVFHHHKDGDPTPLPGVEVLIASHCGDGFARHMERLGIRAAMTAETDPARAVAAYLAETLPPPRARPFQRLICAVVDRVSGHR